MSKVIDQLNIDAHNNALRKLNEANARIVEFEDIKKGHLKVQEDMAKRIEELKAAIIDLTERADRCLNFFINVPSYEARKDLALSINRAKSVLEKK